MYLSRPPTGRVPTLKKCVISGSDCKSSCKTNYLRFTRNFNIGTKVTVPRITYTNFVFIYIIRKTNELERRSGEVEKYIVSDLYFVLFRT